MKAIFRIKPYLWLLAAGLVAAAAHPAAAKYYRNADAIPDVLLHADDAGTNSEGASAVIVDKAEQRVRLYRYHGRWRALAQWDCSTGKRRGRKEAEGDKKTPEGVYFVTRDVSGRFLSDTYGSRALPLDYPNWTDQRQDRTGSAIWIHGTNKPLRPYDSNGCVVMANADISDLARYVTIRKTPVIIVDRLQTTTTRKMRAESRAILATLSQWQHALTHESYQAFRQYYAADVQPSMSWWRQWCRQRRLQGINAAPRSIGRQRTIFREGNTYVVVFDHFLATEHHQVWAGRRKLHCTLADGKVTIIGDTYLSRGELGSDPLFHAWKKLWTIDQRDCNVAAGRKSSSET